MSELSLESQLERLRSDFAIIKSEYIMMRNQLDKLQKIVIDGNGIGPIVSRLAVVENKTMEFKDTLNKTEGHSMGIKLALLVGFVGFISNILILIFEFTLKGR